MSDKPTATNGEYSAIPGWSVVALRGADASRFAQAQFMGDVDALTPGHWQWNGWLTPKGRVIALFALLKRDESDLLLLLADAEPDGFVAALSRFVFRSKLRITRETAWHATGAFKAPAVADLAAFERIDAGMGVELDVGGAGGTRTLRTSAQAGITDAAAEARWKAADLAHGLPRLGPAQFDQWTPQQLSLERLRAYSVKKGCYPGQEIVARTHFLGQAKRGLLRLSAASELPTGDVLPLSEDAPPRAVGEVVCTAGGEGLAVMPLDAGDGPFLVAGTRCDRLPLLDGLAR